MDGFSHHIIPSLCTKLGTSNSYKHIYRHIPNSPYNGETNAEQRFEEADNFKMLVSPKYAL